MNPIPWRVRNFASEHFPLLYHLVANIGLRGNSQEYWDRQLERTWDDPARYWPTKNELIASLTARTDTIIDVGCGNGGILRALRDRGYERLHGLEVSNYSIERLRREGIEMHYGMLPAIPLPDATFDVVIASQVLEHIIRRRRFLGEMRRVLKPGGRAFIFVPDNCMGPIDVREHVTKFDARSLRAAVAGCFRVIALDSIRDVNHPEPVLFAQGEKPRA